MSSDEMVAEMRAAGFFVEFHGEHPVNVCLKSPQGLVWCSIGDRDRGIRDQYEQYQRCVSQSPEEPMKIEAGKYYKTRGGDRAYVAAIVHNPFGESPIQPVQGYIEDVSAAEIDEWSANGHYFSDRESTNDLVAEWEEPKVHKRWGFWYRSQAGTVMYGYATNEKEALDLCAAYYDDYLCGQEVTYTEKD